MTAIRIHISKPCGENWNAMTPVSDNRAHCAACEKTLVDFSRMSDTEIALWFAQNKGKICGRFSKDQLNRRIAVPAGRPVKKYWLNALWLLPLTWLAKPALAQTTPHVIIEKPARCVPVGGVQKQAQQTSTVVEKKLQGTVKDRSTGKAIANARVVLYDSTVILTIHTDAKGRFTLVIPAAKKGGALYVAVYSDGYEYAQHALSAEADSLHFRLEQETEIHMMGDVSYEPEK